MPVTKLGNMLTASDIILEPFDREFVKTIDDYHAEWEAPEQSKLPLVMHTIAKNKKKQGVVGYYPLQSGNFFQIGIHSNYRGQGLLSQAAAALAKEYNLNELLATIDESNVASIKAHLKAGFTPLPQEQEEQYKKLRPTGHLGLIKKFNI
jgi:RimJ/RimL family protein N-acetyltransferase